MPTEVDRHTQECVEQADSGVLPTNSLEEVVERLAKHGSADYEHIRCDYFGIHSMDRSTFGMDPYAMNSLADNRFARLQPQEVQRYYSNRGTD